MKFDAAAATILLSSSISSSHYFTSAFTLPPILTPSTVYTTTSTSSLSPPTTADTATSHNLHKQQQPQKIQQSQTQSFSYSSTPSQLWIATATTTEESALEDDEIEELSISFIKKLSFRELRTHCKKRGLPAKGTTAVLRERLLESAGLCQDSNSKNKDECDLEKDDDAVMVVPEGIVFTDDSDPNFDYDSLHNELLDKCAVGHWKSAVRKLKQLRSRFADHTIPQDTYVRVLEVCAQHRLHGARAAESARKVLEEMTDVWGYEVPPVLGNQCVVHCLGAETLGKHDGFGGIDTALAMLSAMENSGNNNGETEGNSVIQMDTFGAVVSALAKDGAVDESLVLLRAMVVEHYLTPSLSIFSDVATAALSVDNESVLQVLSLAKAAGYELDSVGTAEAGRQMLACGVVVAERLDNLSLGLRLLTAASKAEGCEPDRGDDLVASSSTAAQRACTLLHKKAIDKAVTDTNWKLAVKLLGLMPQRSLTPSTSVWRKVVTVCAKAEKSKRATGVLFDWVKYAETGKVDKPPVKVFNTVINTCEICGEEELTQAVLDSMRKTHDIDGNLITFNIAMKRLAKLGAARACEGIVVGMLQSGTEPNVVTYTTAVAACVKAKDPAFAEIWLDRMRSRNVKPNFHTYNTALAACLPPSEDKNKSSEGDLECTKIASRIASQMLADIDEELETGLKGSADFRSVLPDTYTKVLARSAVKQLRDNWRAGEIDMEEAKNTLRVPLLKLVDFDKGEAAEKAKKQMEENKEEAEVGEEENMESVENDEDVLEYEAINRLHRQGYRVAEV